MGRLFGVRGAIKLGARLGNAIVVAWVSRAELGSASDTTNVQINPFAKTCFFARAVLMMYRTPFLELDFLQKW
jgi:hypothetical protein